jgi:hypothetical protein
MDAFKSKIVVVFMEGGIGDGTATLNLEVTHPWFITNDTITSITLHSYRKRVACGNRQKNLSSNCNDSRDAQARWMRVLV